MVVIEKERIGDIPVLHIAQKERYDEKLPFIIFIHGFTSAKEHNLHYAYLMAEKGFRVLLPDAVYHGERSQGYSETQLMMRFWGTVVQTIKEIEILKNDLLNRNLILPDKIGISGTSMGGIVTNGAMAVYKWISAGVSLMGNPSYVKYARMQMENIQKHAADINIPQQEMNKQLELIRDYDLSLHSDKLAGRPMLYWHGAKDPVVPYKHASDFYESMRPAYAHAKGKLQFILDKQAGHKVSREGVLKTAEWFETFLGQAGQKA
ncbi:hypothetical protein SAMN05443252_101246 [Bacillus sp. OV322]|uniref:prolyl oligopeptidase family serine peptidase n=1 Tax=Bacillus sp. OV322 TaxID=1882764 RepID=UPI0008E1ED79|nr:prolyl oligopeptidase family serine peptidase [Bacillus sp. OV322]SFB97122.1 hypothetical protein SAMN05443252_101246 [Bacillus sp. OV322]